jgi:hypothetical protein
MRFVFRKPSAHGTLDANPGELRIEPRDDGEPGRRALAESVLRAGPTVLVGDAAGPFDTIVLPPDPSLDDMLAATIVERVLAGAAVPDGIAAFAQYAALVREGLRPGKVALDNSLEGIYLAILTTAGEDLPIAEVADRFLEGWSRLATAILQAAQARKDPFTESFLEDDLNFARERAFLAGDAEVYRHDVSRGERWVVRLPDGPPTACALILRNAAQFSRPGHALLNGATTWKISSWGSSWHAVG